MIPFLASPLLKLASPLLKIGALVVAALGLWGWIAFKDAKIDRQAEAIETYKAREAVKDSALESAKATIDQLKANEAAATAARKAVADKLKVSETRLSAARKAIDNAAPATCDLPDTLRAVLDGLRRKPAAPSGDANPDHQATPARRVAIVP